MYPGAGSGRCGSPWPDQEEVYKSRAAGREKVNKNEARDPKFVYKRVQQLARSVNEA